MSEYIERGALLDSPHWDSLKNDFDRARAKVIVACFPALSEEEMIAKLEAENKDLLKLVGGVTLDEWLGGADNK